MQSSLAGIGCLFRRIAQGIGYPILEPTPRDQVVQLNAEPNERLSDLGTDARQDDLGAEQLYRLGGAEEGIGDLCVHNRDAGDVEND